MEIHANNVVKIVRHVLIHKVVLNAHKLQMFIYTTINVYQEINVLLEHLLIVLFMLAQIVLIIVINVLIVNHA